jgi:hypothetical protein
VQRDNSRAIARSSDFLLCVLSFLPVAQSALFIDAQPGMAVRMALPGLSALFMLEDYAPGGD